MSPDSACILVGRLQQCQGPALFDKDKAKEYLAELAKVCEMTIIDGPRALLVDPRQTDPGGISASSMWAESGVLVGPGCQSHTWPEWNCSVELVIHSCKNLDKATVRNLTNQYYQPQLASLYDVSPFLTSKEPMVPVRASLLVKLVSDLKRHKGQCPETYELERCLETDEL